MRIAVVDSYYEDFLRAHYVANPDLARQPYEEQLRSLLDTMFGTSDAYTVNLRRAGQAAENVIVNCRPLQARWAAEHDLPRRLRLRVPAARIPPLRDVQLALLRGIALAQIASLHADVVYVQGLATFTKSDLDRLRAMGLLVAGQIASPLPAAGVVGAYDVVFTSFPHYVERLRERGVDSEYLQLAFDARVLERLRDRGIDAAASAERPHPVTFVGGIHPRWHGSGVRLLERVAERAGLEVWGWGAGALPRGSALRAAFRGQAWGLDMYALLARSRIVINRHIDAAEGYANNMRLYEASGTGALVITEAAPNLGDILEPGVEVVTYEGADDLVDKVRHYLEHDEERRRIAAAGQARTLREHTYELRMRELAALLEPRLSRSEASISS